MMFFLGVKKLVMICLKLVKIFLFEIMILVGVWVDFEVYCKYVVFGVFLLVGCVLGLWECC